jgi:uncharacterized protein (DUF433 family)
MTYDSITGRDLLNTLNFPIYPIYQTSRLVGIPKWTVKRYLRGYEYKYLVSGASREGHQPPVINPTEGSSHASFLDLIDLLYVKEFLERGFTLHFLRQALTEARERLGTPHFARSVFFTSGDQIVLKLPKDGNLIALMTGGQLTIQEITEKLNSILDFENVTEYGLAQRWYPNGKNGRIVIDPRVSFGQPTLIGYGTSTNNIYDLYLGENKKVKPVSGWFNIPAPQIRTAVQFEHSLWG